ncbi:MAG: hypothetical protein Q9214_001803 [Letrouitia sp. 1 TL-2023]
MTSTPSSASGEKERRSPTPSGTSSINSVASGDAPTTSIPTPYVSDKTEDSSKLRTFLSILRKFIGVADIASVRFSLPAQLLEPTPNLEYWNYLDRPETFIGSATCNWEIEDTSPSVLGDGPKVSASGEINTENRPVRVSYLTEQTSHHPPVSAFWVDCPVKGISAYGFDQLSAKFTGTSVRVTPGAHNLGIFINLQHRDNEEYRLTHPAAQLAGLLRGSLSISVADTCFVTCPKSKIKVILQYLEEGWLGKAQNRVNGVIFQYDPENDNKVRIKDVPEKDILAKLEGCWQDEIYYTLTTSKDPQLLIDLKPLWPMPKIIPPESQQLRNESRRFWQGVTEAILSRQYNQATKLKQELEERQREKAAARKEQGLEWQPRFFTKALVASGKPELTEDGRQALQGLQANDYFLRESSLTSA